MTGMIGWSQDATASLVGRAANEAIIHLSPGIGWYPEMLENFVIQEPPLPTVQYRRFKIDCLTPRAVAGRVIGVRTLGQNTFGLGLLAASPDAEPGRDRHWSPGIHLFAIHLTLGKHDKGPVLSTLATAEITWSVPYQYSAGVEYPGIIRYEPHRIEGDKIVPPPGK